MFFHVLVEPLGLKLPLPQAQRSRGWTAYFSRHLVTFETLILPKYEGRLFFRRPLKEKKILSIFHVPKIGIGTHLLPQNFWHRGGILYLTLLSLVIFASSDWPRSHKSQSHQVHSRCHVNPGTNKNSVNEKWYFCWIFLRGWTSSCGNHMKPSKATSPQLSPWCSIKMSILTARISSGCQKWRISPWVLLSFLEFLDIHGTSNI